MPDGHVESAIDEVFLPLRGCGPDLVPGALFGGEHRSAHELVRQIDKDAILKILVRYEACVNDARVHGDGCYGGVAAGEFAGEEDVCEFALAVM